ncbi:hypothetical protein OIE66_26045 [Nonomuraea sp. NBC_01738]|uniref:hypothetical protein n=1 Tax=Nonomuraea sp. NBC_01738 TaxID=2976003 RepID=UPI002E110EFE|nr:hypothetical protein OIE66_26045 [Nonomuraea sp. NBC_01738]
MCDDALTGLHAAVADLDLERRGLVRALLVKETRRSVDRVFHTAQGGPDTEKPGKPGKPGTEPPPHRDRPPDPGGLFSMACTVMVCCTCGVYRPPWDEEYDQTCGQRCDPGCCDACSNCGECCSCCGDGGCCDCDCSC